MGNFLKEKVKDIFLFENITSKLSGMNVLHKLPLFPISDDHHQSVKLIHWTDMVQL